MDNSINVSEFTPDTVAMQRYLEMTQLYDSAIREVRTKMEILDREFRVRYARNPIHHIESRLKSPASIVEKLSRKGLPLTIDSAESHIYDIAGVRVICNYIQDIYQIADILTHQRDVELVLHKDYIKNAKPNGYRSLHLVIRIPVYLSSHTELVPVEIQIRTIAMDFWASLEHELRYKKELDASDDLMIRLKQCADNSAALDAEMESIYLEINSNEPRPVQKSLAQSEGTVVQSILRA